MPTKSDILQPEHVNPKEEPIARAPYNFVPLPAKVVTVDVKDLPDHDAYCPDLLNGYIDCLLTTETPIYVRSTLTLDEFLQNEKEARGVDKPDDWRKEVRNKPDFFSTDLDKTPRIPGSSLRGMLRSLVEIVSYGKISAVSNQRLVYRAVGDTTSHGTMYRDRIMHTDVDPRNRNQRVHQYTPRVKAGYMEKHHDDWYIRPAQEIGGVSFARIHMNDIPQDINKTRDRALCNNARRIYFRPGPYEYRDVRGGFLQIRMSRVVLASSLPAEGLLEGYLVYSGAMASKRTEAVVYPPDRQKKLEDLIPLDDDVVRAYREQVSQEQSELLGGKDGVLRNGQPVFYLQEPGVAGKPPSVFFGHTMMMRLPYPHTPLDFVPENLRHEQDIDLAEAIFGYTKRSGKDKARAFAGRIQVGDALLEPGQPRNKVLPHRTNGEPDYLIPRILGGPKPTTFQHYLTQQAPDDKEIGRKRDGTPMLQKQLSDYADSRSRTALRGHKLYWHQGPDNTAMVQEALDKLQDERGEFDKHDTQHTRMWPVAAGVHFRSRITFEHLSPIELGALLWVLTLPGAAGQEYRHSIGMGKPLGMGAIKVEPALFLEERPARYAALFGETGNWAAAMQPAGTEQVQTMVGTFEDFVVAKVLALDPENGSLPRLATLERIQMLLKLLGWPGPARELTKYMEIEKPDPNLKRGKVNEYKSRPVLPDPLHVEQASRSAAPTRNQQPSAPAAQRAVPPTLGTAASPAPAQPPPPARPAPPPRVPVPPAEPQLAQPASAAEVKDGMYLEGKVARIDFNRIVVDICGEEASLMLENCFPPVFDDYERNERFPAGVSIRVWVKGRSKSGRLQLTMVRPK